MIGWGNCIELGDDILAALDRNFPYAHSMLNGWRIIITVSI